MLWPTCPARLRRRPQPPNVIDEAEKAKREAATEKQPVEKAPPAQPLADYVADVIEEQLRNLEEAKKAKQEADQCVSTPDPAPRQPVLVMEGSKEDAGSPPQVVAKQPDAVAEAPPPADVVSAPDPVPARPMLAGDLQRALRAARNAEVVARENAKIRKGLH
jgi:hypothetical protein